MGENAATAGAPTSRELLIEQVRRYVRDFAEARDLVGLVAVAEVSLRTLQMLCERPTTCSELHAMLASLDRIGREIRENGEE